MWAGCRKLSSSVLGCTSLKCVLVALKDVPRQLIDVAAIFKSVQSRLLEIKLCPFPIIAAGVSRILGILLVTGKSGRLLHLERIKYRHSLVHVMH